MGSRHPVSEFWEPLISRERLKLETSNLAGIRKAVSSNEENAKLGQNRSRAGHVTVFKFGDLPNISQTVKAKNFKFGTETDGGKF